MGSELLTAHYVLEGMNYEIVIYDSIFYNDSARILYI